MDTIFKILLVFIFLFKLIKSEVLVDEHNYRYEKIADQVIYKKRNVYACFPKLYKLKDTLVIRFSARTLRSHYDKSGGVIELISIDNGQTWQMSNNKVLFFPGYKNNKNEYVTIGPKGWQKVKKREVERYKSNGVIIKETSGQYWQATGVVVTTNNNKGEIINTRSPVLPKHAFLMGYNLSSYLKFGNGMRLLGLYGRILKDDKVVGFLVTKIVDLTKGHIIDFIIDDEVGYDDIIKLSNNYFFENGIVNLSSWPTSVKFKQTLDKIYHTSNGGFNTNFYIKFLDKKFEIKYKEKITNINNWSLPMGTSDAF